MNTNAMLAIFAIATLALIVPLTMNIQPAYSQDTRCRDSSFEGGSIHRCVILGSEPSGTETICNDTVGCVTFEDTNDPPSSSGQLSRLYESCSESQSPRPLPGRTAECSVQPDDNAR